MLFHNSIEIPLDKFCWVENAQKENEFKSFHVEADNFVYHVHWEKQTNKTLLLVTYILNSLETFKYFISKTRDHKVMLP